MIELYVVLGLIGLAMCLVGRRRRVAVALYAALLIVGYVALLDLLGRPRPADLSWGLSGQAQLLAAVIAEGEAIYVWLAIPDEREPRALKLPWNLVVARQLHEARRIAEERGTGVLTRLPLDGTPGAERMFWPAPRPSSPPKDP